MVERHDSSSERGASSEAEIHSSERLNIDPESIEAYRELSRDSEYREYHDRRRSLRREKRG